jgi:hypothetical protein
MEPILSAAGAASWLEADMSFSDPRALTSQAPASLDQSKKYQPKSFAAIRRTQIQ